MMIDDLNISKIPIISIIIIIDGLLSKIKDLRVIIIIIR